MLNFLETYMEVKKIKLPEVIIVCPWCSTYLGSPDKKGHFYFNIEKEKGYCQRCKFVINSKEHLAKLLGVPLKTKEDFFLSPIIPQLRKDDNNLITNPSLVLLPKEALPLWEVSTGERNQALQIKAIQYLYSRNIDDTDIKKYQLYFVTYGEFKNRIIIPYYENSTLRFFIGRTFVDDYKRYKNYSGNINDLLPFYEEYVGTYNYCILVEGWFCAIRLRKLNYPAIPLNGSDIHINQLKKLSLFEKNILLLDTDMIQHALRLSKKLNSVRLFIAVNETKKDLDELSDDTIINIIANHARVNTLVDICRRLKKT